MKDFSKNKLVTLILAIAVVILSAALIFSLSKNETVARVGDAKITKDDLYDRLVRLYGAETLDTMIANKLVEIEAEKQNITVTDEEIQKEMDEVIESYGGQENFENQLANAGFTKKDMEKDIILYLKTLKLIEPRIEITEEEISAFFEENKDEFVKSEQEEANLEDYREEIKEEIKMEKLSTEYSAWLSEMQADYEIYNSLSGE